MATVRLFKEAGLLKDRMATPDDEPSGSKSCCTVTRVGEEALLPLLKLLVLTANDKRLSEAGWKEANVEKNLRILEGREASPW